ncbi:phosphopantetheine-binding protein [Azohydromonas aeria]|uniref:phosphopantetheine-binding protein n=1 Tax=Azohydromonas aeria TaxID=2590212 RepID=UPI0012F7FF2D|nr:phosphopantetheine-binding protein [Azohydromonas aeria]
MNTTTESTEQRVERITAEVLGLAPATVSQDTELHKHDSLDLVELVMALEDEVGIELADDDCEKCRTVADFTRLVQAAGPEASL